MQIFINILVIIDLIEKQLFSIHEIFIFRRESQILGMNNN